MKRQSFTSLLSVVGIGAGFVMMVCSSLVYMAKDYNVYNAVYAFFGVDSDLRIALTMLPISRQTLLRILNAGHGLFLYSSLGYALLFSSFLSPRVIRYTLVVALIPMVVQLVLLDPGVVAWLYLESIGPFADIPFFRATYAMLPKVLRGMGILLSLLAASVLTVAFVRTPRALRGGMGLITLLFDGVHLIFLYLFSWLPVQTLWMSRVAHYIRYDSLPVYATTSFSSFAPLISVLFVICLVLATLYYLRSFSVSRRNDMAFRSKISAVDVMSRVFCHYLKNELLSQQAELRLLMQRVTPDIQPDVAYIIARNDEIYQRLSSVRDAMKEKKASLEHIDLFALVEQAVEEMGLPPEVRLEWRNTPHTCYVTGNPYQLREAVECLVRNALEASADIPVTRRLRVVLEPLRRYAVVTIANNGPRIEPERRETIFDPFVSTKPSSSNWGLGLALCRNIITLHHGRIWVEERTAEGETLTCFCIALPLVD